ncbi:MAG: hypothetical protein C6Y20_02325 [Tagaea sp. CACIAM 22H2]|nr:hypothetical protein [Tagaea sp. CACIAM 22H2]
MYLDARQGTAELLVEAAKFFREGNWKEAIASIIGSAIGVFGAFLVARWQITSAERTKRRQRSALASAFYNVVQDRYLGLKGLVEALELANDLEIEVFLTKATQIDQSTINFTFAPIPDAVQTMIATELPYESVELYDLETCLAFARNRLRTVIGSKIPRDEHLVRKELIKAIDALATAALDWQNIVNGCDILAADAGFPEKFAEDVEAADKMVATLKALNAISAK